MKLNTETYRTGQMNARCDVTDLWFQSSFRSSASRQQSVTETRVRISLSMSETGILSAARRQTRWRFQRLKKKRKKLKKSFIQMTRCLSKQTANSVATVASRQLIRVFAFGKRDATYSSLQLRENASLIKNEINKWGKKKRKEKRASPWEIRGSRSQQAALMTRKSHYLLTASDFYHETTRTCTSAGRAHSRADMNEFA